VSAEPQTPVGFTLDSITEGEILRDAEGNIVGNHAATFKPQDESGRPGVVPLGLRLGAG
jgi:hypothetical protein